MIVEEFFTVDGGFVKLAPRTAHESWVIAITAGEDDLGVALSEREAMRIAKWMLRQVLGDDDYRVVLAVLLATRWSANDVEDERAEAAALLADRSVEAMEDAADRAREAETEARYAMEMHDEPEPF